MDQHTVVLEAKSIDKRFGALHVLKGVSLVVGKGETVVVIGPSGSGKSTFLRCVCGLENLDGGELYVEGRLLVDSNSSRSWHGRRKARERFHELRGEIGMIFQRFNLFPHMTALGNVMEGPVQVRQVPPAEAQRLARELLGKVGLADKVDAYPAKLSGGQQQRVAIARALAMQPRILLFDEVTSALDPELVGEVLKVMRALAREGMTMIVVTHEMQFAEDVADRVLFMDEGAIVEEGPPAQLFKAPTHKRTRTFLQRIIDR